MIDDMWSSLSIGCSDGETLVASILEPAERPVATVLMYAGFTSKRLNSTNTRLAELLFPKDIRCIAVDLSGHGDSTGHIENQTVTKAASEIADCIGFVERHFENSMGRLGVLGNSFSANAAILAVAEAPVVRALALKSPVTDYEQMRAALLGPSGMSDWERDGEIVLPDGTPSKWSFIEDARNSNAYTAISQIQATVLAVFGSEDEEIPKESRLAAIRSLREAGHQAIVIEGADHNLSDPYFSETISLLGDFLLANLAPSGA